MLIENNQSFIKRYDWVDVFKFLGIFAIYLGHCGTNAGRLYPFVFTYHVPLFFFASGFFAEKDKNKTIKEFIIKKTKQLLLPYCFFAIVSTISFAIANNLNGKEVLISILKYLIGIRNTLDAASLWFIPCIFILSIMYFMLNKIFIKKYFMLVISIILFIITQTILPNNPLENPSWFMNIDSAMYYMIYYAIGDLVFNSICKFNYGKLNVKNKFYFIVLSIIMFLVTLIIYFEGAGEIYNYIINKLNILSKYSLFNSIYNVMISFVIIYINILIAFMLKHIPLLKVIGSNTLLLCCTENVVKVYCVLFMEIIGLSINLYNPLSCVFYTFVVLIISNWISINIFNKYFLNRLYKK